jgi:hypothetical protein
MHAQRMRTSVTVVCVSAVYMYKALKSIVLQFEFTGISAGFTLRFQGFQLTDFDKKPLFKRYSAFHGYFVVSRLYKRLRIPYGLAVAL